MSNLSMIIRKYCIIEVVMNDNERSCDISNFGCSYGLASGNTYSHVIINCLSFLLITQFEDYNVAWCRLGSI